MTRSRDGDSVVFFQNMVQSDPMQSNSTNTALYFSSASAVGDLVALAPSSSKSEHILAGVITFTLIMCTAASMYGLDLT